MKDFSYYYLKMNPFPESAFIIPTDPDPRINGSIFQKSIFEKEINNLRHKVERGVNVVYISGIQYDKGVGKSALMIHQWRECCSKEKTTSLYIRCGMKDKLSDICKKIIEKWHGEGHLWKAFKECLLEYSKDKNDPRLAPDAIEALLRAHPTLPETLPLTLYTQIRNEKTLAEGFARWTALKIMSKEDALIPYFETYLLSPRNYPNTFGGKKIDPLVTYRTLLSLLSYHGYEKHFVFLDQFEDMVMGTSKSKMWQLALELRNLIEASAGKTTFFVTLHPSSETLLRMSSAKDLTGIAPLDAIHRVDVMHLDTSGDSALLLAEEYFEFFREGEPPYSTYPLEPELVEVVCFLENGLIRSFLQQLHNCLKYCAMMELPELTLEHALENQLEVFGRELDKKLLDRFYRLKE